LVGGGVARQGKSLPLMLKPRFTASPSRFRAQDVVPCSGLPIGCCRGGRGRSSGGKVCPLDEQGRARGKEGAGKQQRGRRNPPCRLLVVDWASGKGPRPWGAWRNTTASKPASRCRDSASMTLKGGVRLGCWCAQHIGGPVSKARGSAGGPAPSVDGRKCLSAETVLRLARRKNPRGLPGTERGGLVAWARLGGAQPSRWHCAARPFGRRASGASLIRTGDDVTVGWGADFGGHGLGLRARWAPPETPGTDQAGGTKGAVLIHQ